MTTPAKVSLGVPKVGTAINRETTPEQFLKEIIPAAVKKAKDTGATSVLGFGWQFRKFEENMPTRQQLDEICSDIPMYIADEEGHKGLVNTIALVNAGIMAADGTVLKKEIRGGEIAFGADGTPTGFLKEQAGTYTRSFLDGDKLFPVDLAKAALVEIQQKLFGSCFSVNGCADFGNAET